MPLVHIIVIRHLEPYHYQNVLDPYEVISLEVFFKDLYDIEIYITLIDQCRGIVK